MLCSSTCISILRGVHLKSLPVLSAGWAKVGPFVAIFAMATDPTQVNSTCICERNCRNRGTTTVTIQSLLSLTSAALKTHKRSRIGLGTDSLLRIFAFALAACDVALAVALVLAPAVWAISVSIALNCVDTVSCVIAFALALEHLDVHKQLSKRVSLGMTKCD